MLARVSWKPHWLSRDAVASGSKLSCSLRAGPSWNAAAGLRASQSLDRHLTGGRPSLDHLNVIVSASSLPVSRSKFRGETARFEDAKPRWPSVRIPPLRHPASCGALRSPNDELANLRRPGRPPPCCGQGGFVLGTISLQCRRLPAERDCPALIDVVHDPRLSEHVAEAGHGRAVGFRASLRLSTRLEFRLGSSAPIAAQA